MLKIIKGGETINTNNEKVASVTLEDGSVYTLTEYMYVDWDEFTETTHEELIECGWVMILKGLIKEGDINGLAQWLLENSEYYFEKAKEEAEELLAKGEDPR